MNGKKEPGLCMKGSHMQHKSRQVKFYSILMKKWPSFLSLPVYVNLYLNIWIFHSFSIHNIFFYFPPFFWTSKDFAIFIVELGSQTFPINKQKILTTKIMNFLTEIVFALLSISITKIKLFCNDTFRKRKSVAKPLV